jgi:hypothetical protein
MVEIVSGATRGTPPVSKLFGPRGDASIPIHMEYIEVLATDSSGKSYVFNCAHDGTASVLVFGTGARGHNAPVAALSGVKAGLTCSFPGR